jgi:hypothetical protein
VGDDDAGTRHTGGGAKPPFFAAKAVGVCTGASSIFFAVVDPCNITSHQKAEARQVGARTGRHARGKRGEARRTRTEMGRYVWRKAKARGFGVSGSADLSKSSAVVQAPADVSAGYPRWHRTGFAPCTSYLAPSPLLYQKPLPHSDEPLLTV